MRNICRTDIFLFSANRIMIEHFFRLFIIFNFITLRCGKNFVLRIIVIRKHCDLMHLQIYRYGVCSMVWCGKRSSSHQECRTNYILFRFWSFLYCHSAAPHPDIPFTLKLHHFSTSRHSDSSPMNNSVFV